MDEFGRDSRPQKESFYEGNVECRELKHGPVASLQMRGKRSEQQDALFATSNGESDILLVADGHGEKKGKIVAQLACLEIKEHLREAMEQGEITDALITNAFAETSQLILEQFEGEGGTTCTLVVRTGDEYTIAHVGDSEMHGFDNSGDRITITAPHRTSSNPSEAERFLRAGGEFDHKDPRRVLSGNSALLMSRAFGYYPATGVIPEPEIAHINVRDRNIKFCIFASDGFWGKLDNEKNMEISAIIKESSTPQECLQKIKAAIRDWDDISDNVTILVF